MAGITPYEGDQLVGNLLYKNADVDRGTSLELLLFTAPTTLTKSMVLADLTEVTGYGYARKTLVDGSWTVNADGTVSYAQQTFTPSGGSWSNVQGYAIITTGTAPVILHIERGAGAPYTVADGQPFNVTPGTAIN